MRLYVDSKFTSPYAMSVFVCLRAKCLDFELKTIDLDAKQNLSNDYCWRRLNTDHLYRLNFDQGLLLT